MNAGVQRMKTNVAMPCDMFMPADLLHWQNACVHWLVKLIGFIGFTRC